MTAANFVSATSGIGRQGFVAEHGLHTADQQAAATAVAEQIDRLGIKTIRAVVVDQHGTPRAKFLSPHAAISALSSGVDFSGAIYSMDTANFVYPAAFAAGGGLGIDSSPGFRTWSSSRTPRPLPGAAMGRQHGLDAVRRLFLHREPRARSTRGTSCARN